MMSENNTNFTQLKANEILNEIKKVVVGQDEFIKQLVVALLSGGHVLVEGVPGVAKTLTAKLLAKTIRADFKRVQFTPDLMPADVTGTKVFDVKSGSFFFKSGPLFTNILLADEINRTPPKTQSALLESMEEHSITIDGETHKLSEPFMVIATQNPVEYEGTYPLPEAQLDRFMLKILVDYMPHKYENNMLSMFNAGFDSSKNEFLNVVEAVCSYEDINKCKEEIQKVQVNEGVINYITSIVRATRNSPNLILGASPRASIALLLVSKTVAAIEGRDFVTPDDIKDFAASVLRHRIVLRPESGIDGLNNDDVITSILNKVEVPR